MFRILGFLLRLLVQLYCFPPQPRGRKPFPVTCAQPVKLSPMATSLCSVLLPCCAVWFQFLPSILLSSFRLGPSQSASLLQPIGSYPSSTCQPVLVSAILLAPKCLVPVTLFLPLPPPASCLPHLVPCPTTLLVYIHLNRAAFLFYGVWSSEMRGVACTWYGPQSKL